MGKKTIGVIAGCIVVVIIAAVLVMQPGNQTSQKPIPPETVSIGMNPAEYAALVYIAQENGFFKTENLEVSVRPYGSGAAALAGVGKGEIDLALCSEYPLVSAAYRGDNVSIIANIDRYQSGYLIGRQDLGIETIPDLNNARIGVEKGTLGEFRLSRFISMNNLDSSDVVIVHVPMSQSLDALANGSVSAVVVLGNDIDPAKQRLGNSLVAWRVDNLQQGYSLLAGRSDWIGSHRNRMIRLLRALERAETFAAEHQAEAKAIVRKRLNVTDTYIEKIWPDHQFTLTLDQSIVLAMEYEARWMGSNNMTGGKNIPNFLDYVDSSALAAVNREAVKIVR